MIPTGYLRLHIQEDMEYKKDRIYGLFLREFLTALSYTLYAVHENFHFVFFWQNSDPLLLVLTTNEVRFFFKAFFLFSSMSDVLC